MASWISKFPCLLPHPSPFTQWLAPFSTFYNLFSVPENIDSLSDLLENYWLGPLAHINPSVFARAEELPGWSWAYRQQWQSRTTQEFYSEWGAPFTFLNETGMTLLCRKDRRRNQDGDPVQAPQPWNPLPQQQQPGYQFRRGR